MVAASRRRAKAIDPKSSRRRTRASTRGPRPLSRQPSTADQAGTPFAGRPPRHSSPNCRRRSTPSSSGPSELAPNGNGGGAPAQAPALEDPVGFEALGDDLVIRALVRAPFFCHGSLHAVNHRLKALLRSDDFRKQRLELGLAEHGLVVAGGQRDGHRVADCHMLWNGRWRPIPPMSGPRWRACSVIIDNEMWVMGGYDGRDTLAAVEVYSPKTASWRSCTPMSQRRTGAVAGVVGGRLVVAQLAQKGQIAGPVLIRILISRELASVVPAPSSSITRCG